MTYRPEDRHGIQQGTLLSDVNVAFYRSFVRQWRKLPNFRGKVRAALELYRVLGLENHHIFETATIKYPARYLAILDIHSWHEHLALIMNGYESDTVRFLVRCYPGEGYFLDVGANIGLICCPFAELIDHSRRGASPQIYCIEAVKSNFDRLLQNIELNNRQNAIVPIGKGVGDCEKIVEIQVEGNLKEGEGTGTASILAVGTAHPCERISLEITTLDKLIGSGALPQDCSLMKIDVDGYDLKVLEGAVNLLTSSRPIIFGEFMKHCLAWHGQSHDDVVDFVRQFDYQVYSKDRGAWRFLSYQKYNVESDLLIIPMEKIPDLHWCLS